MVRFNKAYRWCGTQSWASGAHAPAQLLDLCVLYPVATHDCMFATAAIEELDEERPGIAALERQMLQKRIGEPLAAVQTLLQRDKVVWTSGFLATPSVGVAKDWIAVP